MKTYNPLQNPNPEEWLDADEDQKTILVADYHKRARIKLPNDRVHAVIHVTVENQIAIGDDIPVKDTLERLMAAGLDRHDAIHAIGSVLTEHFRQLMSEKNADTEADPNEAYFRKLRTFTAKQWYKEFGQ